MEMATMKSNMAAGALFDIAASVYVEKYHGDDNAIIVGSVYSLAECIEPLPDEEVRIQCPHCSYNCTNRAYLRRHIRVHTGEQPYHCTFCSRRFKDRSNLNRHRRCHTGERPYECEHCGLRFNQTSSLKTHVLGQHKQ